MVYSGIKNLAVWFRVIWCDRQMDHNFFDVILRHKLVLMRNHFKNHGCHVGADREAKKMSICINLLDRVIADQYSDDYKKSEEIMEQDLDMLYKIIRKNIRSWWD